MKEKETARKIINGKGLTLKLSWILIETNCSIKIETEVSLPTLQNEKKRNKKKNKKINQHYHSPKFVWSEQNI